MKKTLLAITIVALFSFALFACQNNAESRAVGKTISAPEKTAPAAINEKAEQAKTDEAVGNAVVPDKVVVYYFHGDYRCPTCTKMEALADKTIKERFSAELTSGKLEWKVVNVDQANNKHFSADYKLYTKSLVLSAIKDDAQIKWKNCEKIWEHIRNPPEYEDYVADEIKAYLSGV